MGIENLGNNEREFLQAFFNNAAFIFTPGSSIERLTPEESLEASVMARIFDNAAKQVQKGDLEAANIGVDGAVTAVKTLTGEAKLRPLVAELLQMESFSYAVTPGQKRAGLGTYKNKMF